MPFKDYKQSILVTGSHRSGSTWLGQMLSIGSDVAYIHEPFNIGLERIKSLGPPIKQTFEYVSKDADKKYEEELRAYLNAADKELTKSSSNRIKSEQSIIVKDPIAFMSAEWFYKTYDTRIITLIRHPAAFVSSLKIKNWYFDFNNLTSQKKLMDDFLFPYRDQIEFFAKKPQGIVDQAILLWNLFYYRTRIYQLHFPDWHYIKHEDLSREPLKELKLLYQKLNLTYDNSIEKEISKSVKPEVKTEFKRDSKANILAWQDRLSKDEISKIKRETKDISQIYYAENDWGLDSKIESTNSELPQALKNRTRSERKTKFSIEVINDIKTENISHLEIEDENIILKGWALGNEGNSIAKGVILKIGDQYFETRYASPRADVARFFKNKDLAMCGFELAFNKNKLSKGEQDVDVLVLNEKDYTEQKFHLNLIIK